jgi:hypothetical protein
MAGLESGQATPKIQGISIDGPGCVIEIIITLGEGCSFNIVYVRMLSTGTAASGGE